MGTFKLVGADNKKLTTKVKYSGNVRKAHSLGNKLRSHCKRWMGTGISANQVGIMERVCVSRNKIFINPVIEERRGGILSKKEGCLSFPGRTGNVKRSDAVRVSYVEFKKGVEIFHDEWFDGYDAIVLQHEIDHLDGIRCIDLFEKEEEQDAAGETND